MKKKIKKIQHPLIEIILDLLDSKSRDISEFSPIVQIGIAKMILAYRKKEVGVESINGLPVSFETFLEEAEIPYTKSLLKKVDKIIEKNILIKDGFLNPIGTENVESIITWLLWANIFDEVLESSIENGERMFKINEKGKKKVEDMLRS